MKKIVRFLSNPTIVKNTSKYYLKAINDIKEFDINMDFILYKDIYYNIDNTFKFIDSGKVVPEYDVYRITGNEDLIMKKAIIYYYGYIKNKKIIDHKLINMIDDSKLSQIIFLNSFGYVSPKSISFVINKEYIKKYVKILESRFSYSFIVKDVFLDRGEGIFKVDNQKELIDILEKNIGTAFLFQEFIKNDGDYRVIVVGDKIVGYFKRVNENDFKNNISTGGKLVKAGISQNIKKLSIEIIRKYDIGIGGLDFFICGDKYYVIEINRVPQSIGFKKEYGTIFEENVLRYFNSI